MSSKKTRKIVKRRSLSRKVFPGAGIDIQSRQVFQKSFLNSLTKNCNLTIISPFVTTIRPWKSIEDFAKFFLKRHSGDLILVTRPPGAAEGILDLTNAERLSAMGVDLRIRSRPPLHSKIYLFEYSSGEYTAYLGSANFTKGGFERNDESVARLRAAGNRAAIIKEVSRLTGQGAFPYDVWRVKERKTA